jgi:predicted acyl esterase
MDNRFFDDGQDGYDAITWVCDQPWSNGDVAM